MKIVPYFFLHIPKCGGSTVVGSLTLNLGRNGYEKMYSTYDSWRQSLDNLHDKKFGGGHHVFGAHRSFKCPLRYFTILRDPLKRQISHYWFAYNGKNARGGIETYSVAESDVSYGRISIDEWVGRSLDGHNIATQFISGGSFVPSGHSRLSIAKGNLKKYFSCFGVCEDMSQYLLLLCAETGLTLPYYYYLNKTKRKDGLSLEPSRAACEKFIADNADDYALYNFVKEQLVLRLAPLKSLYDDAMKIVKTTQDAINQVGNINQHSILTEILEHQMEDRVHEIVNTIDQTAVMNFFEAYRKENRNEMAPQYIGNVDHVIDQHIYGWAINLVDPSKPVRLIVENEKGDVVASGYTEHQRYDVTDAGYPNSRCGFIIQLPSIDKAFRVKIEGSHETLHNEAWWKQGWHCGSTA